MGKQIQYHCVENINSCRFFSKTYLTKIIAFLKNESQGHALRARAAILRCLENGGNARS